jgi:D-serine deaminase-like pyridoxal phosphate-dependent protein
VKWFSAGGTGTYDITGNDPRVTEIQAGSYVFMDNFHGNLVPGFSPALTLLGTVVTNHGKTVVLDSGRKSVGIDFVLPTMVDYPYCQARYFAEEHAPFDVDERCRLKLGDTVELIPGYAPTRVNLYDAYHVVEKDYGSRRLADCTPWAWTHRHFDGLKGTNEQQT